MLSCFSHVWLFVTLWTIAHQAPMSMGFSKQEYWTGLPCPPPGHLPDPGIEPTSFTPLALAGRFLSLVPPGKPNQSYVCVLSSFSCVWTLCDPMDCSLPGFSVHGILQARILDWVVMPSSRGSSRPRDQTLISYIT